MRHSRFLQNLILSLLVASCAQVPNEFICRSRTPDSGFCTKTISDEDIIIDDSHLFNGKTWWDVKEIAVIVPVESWAEIKKYIIKQCKNNNDCNSNIGSWDRKINLIDKN